ncbi:MAG TPA: tetratricopeptide repeat protein [Nitrospirota bacterium]
MKFDNKKYTPLLILAGLCILAYANGMRGPFVYDDYHAVIDNPFVTNPARILDYLTGKSVAQSFSGWRPLWHLSYLLNYLLSGPDTLSYHLFNLLLHIFNTTLVFLLAYRLLSGRTSRPALAAFLAGAVFALQPLQTEAVTYIVGRSALLVTFFYLLGFYAWLAYRETGKAWLAAVPSVCLLLGGLSKENAVTLPVVIFIYEFMVRRGEKKPIKPLAAVFAAGAVFAAVRVYIAGPTEPASVGRSVLVHWATEVYVIPQYILKMLLPFNQNIDQLIPPVQSMLDPRFFVSAAILLIIFCGIYRLWRVDRLFAFLCVWFFVAISVETVVPLSDFMAEHRVYLPAAGLCIIFGSLADRTRPRLVMFAAIPLLFMALTLDRNTVYQSGAALWLDSVSKRPNNPRAHFNLGKEYMNAGRLVDAAEEMEAALKLQPDNYFLMEGLGAVYDELGQDAKAEKLLKGSIALKPDYADAWYGLGTFYLKRKMVADAIPALEKASGQEGYNAEFRKNLGSAYFMAGRMDDAERAYLEALELSPHDADAHFNYAALLAKAGRSTEAAGQYRLYLEYSPDAPDRQEVEEKVRRLSGRP